MLADSTCETIRSQLPANGVSLLTDRTMDIAEIELRLERWFLQIPGAVAAFSGGVDSALVLFLARKFLGKDRAFGCISDSPSLKRADLKIAKDFCSSHDIRLEIINTTEIDDEAYYSNPVNRCYACKSHLYQDLTKLLLRFPGFVALNGTNANDYGDYRPGLQAAAQHEIKSPLADCRIDKKSVRALARHYGLEVWDKPASPCLSSRIPYGQKVTREKLSQIELAESILNRYGFLEARVRHFGDEARIEVPSEQVSKLRPHFAQLEKSFSALGFRRTFIDEEGLVSGKLNRAISK